MSPQPPLSVILRGNTMLNRQHENMGGRVWFSNFLCWAHLRAKHQINWNSKCSIPAHTSVNEGSVKYQIFDRMSTHVWTNTSAYQIWNESTQSATENATEKCTTLKTPNELLDVESPKGPPTHPKPQQRIEEQSKLSNSYAKLWFERAGAKHCK